MPPGLAQPSASELKPTLDDDEWPHQTVDQEHPTKLPTDSESRQSGYGRIVFRSDGARAAPNTLSPRSMDDLRSIDADTEYPSETNVCPGDCDPVCQEVEEPTHSLQWARVSNRALSGVPGNVSDIKFASIERERMRILESDGEWAHAEMPNRLTSVLSSRCPIIKSALGMAAC